MRIVIFYVAIFALTLANAKGLPVVTDILAPAAPVFRLSGLTINWAVFAPPPSDDIQVFATTTMSDGTVERFNLTRGGPSGGSNRYLHDRWRKYAMEWLRLDKNKDLWKPAARFFLISAMAEGKLPRKITLTRSWRNMMDRNATWQQFDFFQYSVLEELQTEDGRRP